MVINKTFWKKKLKVEFPRSDWLYIGLVTYSMRTPIDTPLNIMTPAIGWMDGLVRAI